MQRTRLAEEIERLNVTIAAQCDVVDTLREKSAREIVTLEARHEEEMKATRAERDTVDAQLQKSLMDTYEAQLNAKLAGQVCTS